MKIPRLYLLLALSLPLIISAQNYSNIELAHNISAKNIKKNIKALTAYKMQGRETGTEGQKLAASYIYSQFKQYGLVAADNSIDSLSFFQAFNLNKGNIPSGTIRVRSKVFVNYKDFIADPIQDSISTNLKIVFIGSSPIEAYTGIDFSDKAVLFLTSNFHKAFGKAHKIWKHSKPKFILFADPIHNNLFEKYLQPRKLILKKRYRLIGNTSQRKNPFDSLNSPEQFEFYKNLNKVQIIPISNNMAKTLTGLKLKNLKKLTVNKTHQRNSTETQISIKLKKNINTIQTENVLGLIEGCEKPEEYIVISAHYDHLGRKGGNIFSGANDNASGVAALMEVARTFKMAANNGKTPKRSILFVAFSGEEKGLLGSKYFVNNPPAPINSIKTNLNMDMLGRQDDKQTTSNYIYLLGCSHLDPHLKQISDSINALYTHLNLDYRFDSPHNPIYGASDQASFVEKGIPSIMYFNGLHKDYHTPGDTADKINYKAIEKVAQLVFLTAWELVAKL